MRALAMLMLVALALAASGCPDEPGAGADAGVLADCGVTVVLEVRTPAGDFVAIDDAEPGAELVLGFQGFRYVYTRARFDRDPGALGPATVTVRLAGTAPRSQPLGALAVLPAPGGGHATEAFSVFFNDDPLPSLIDRACGLEIRLAGGACVGGGETTLRYDPDCYEGPDGQRVCPDAGPAGDATVGEGAR